MTNPNHSHITVIADRTGSMQAIRSDAEGAINQFVRVQKEQPGTASLLLVDFDSDEPFRVVHDGDLAAAGSYQLQPRSLTPLYDAIGRGIVRTGEKLAALAEDDRPGHVFFVICTDGFENASREYDLARVTAMIKEHEERWSWEFIFLATGKDAWKESERFVGTQMVANTVRSASTGESYAASTAYLAANISSRRAGGQSVSYGGDVDEHGNVTPS